MRAALYIRFAHDPSGTPAADAQKNILMNYARREDMEVTKIYQDIGFSGTHFNRPSLQALLTDAKEGLMDAVLVKDYSRLGRDTIQTANLVKELRAHGVQVKTPYAHNEAPFPIDFDALLQNMKQECRQRKRQTKEDGMTPVTAKSI